MAHINAEKLIAELRKLLIPTVLDRGYDEWEKGEDNGLLKAIDIITSLQQEQPDNEDIDKVAQELYEHLYELKRRNNVPTNLYDKQEIIDLWKAGVEYGRNHPKQEHPIVDLEGEAEKYFGGFWKTFPLLVQRELINFARTFVAKGYILAKGL